MLGEVPIYHCQCCDNSPLALNRNGEVPVHRIEKRQSSSLLNKICPGSGQKPRVKTIEVELIPAL